MTENDNHVFMLLSFSEMSTCFRGVDCKILNTLFFIPPVHFFKFSFTGDYFEVFIKTRMRKTLIKRFNSEASNWDSQIVPVGNVNVPFQVILLILFLLSEIPIHESLIFPAFGKPKNTPPPLPPKN